MIYATYNMTHGLLSAAHDMGSSVSGVNFDRITGDGAIRLSVAMATDELAAIIQSAVDDINVRYSSLPLSERDEDAWDEALNAIEFGELIDGRVGTVAESKASLKGAGSFRGDYIGDIDGLAGHAADVVVTVDGTEARFTGTGTGYDGIWMEFPDASFVPVGEKAASSETRGQNDWVEAHDTGRPANRMSERSRGISE